MLAPEVPGNGFTLHRPCMHATTQTAPGLVDTTSGTIPGVWSRSAGWRAFSCDGGSGSSLLATLHVSTSWSISSGVGILHTQGRRRLRRYERAHGTTKTGSDPATFKHSAIHLPDTDGHVRAFTKPTCQYQCLSRLPSRPHDRHLHLYLHLLVWTSPPQ